MEDTSALTMKSVCSSETLLPTNTLMGTVTQNNSINHHNSEQPHTTNIHAFGTSVRKAVAKNDYYLRVCPSVWNGVTPTGQIFLKFHI
jgi:hypothetical protein